MDKVRKDLQTLYQREERHPPGMPLATHMYPAKVNDEIPLDAELEEMVRRLRKHRAGGNTHLHKEHFKHWRRDAYPREQSKTPPTYGSLEVSGRHCTAHLAHGEIPQDLVWNVLVLILKGNTNTRDIGLINTLWNMGRNNIIVGSNEIHSVAKDYVNVVNAITSFIKATPPTNIITKETILNQYSIKQGLKVFGKKGEATVQKELQQFHDCRVVEPKKPQDLSYE